MNDYANVDIKIKGSHEAILEAAMFLKNHYDMEDFKETEDGQKLFAYLEHSQKLSDEKKIRQMIGQLTAIVPQISLSMVGFWHRPNLYEYQDFFYKYKNGEFYYQTSDVYGKEEINEELSYEEFCAMFDINPSDEDAISEDEFKNLLGNEIYMSVSGEFMDDLD